MSPSGSKPGTGFVIHSVKAADNNKPGLASKNVLNPIDESGEVEFKVSRGFKITPTPLNNEIKKLVPEIETFGGVK